MIVYLITTTLLSCIGWVLYLLLVRGRFSFKQQKLFIFSIILGSFIFPLLLSSGHAPMLRPNPYVRPLAFGQAIEHEQLQSFCRCERPDYTHRVHYRTNASINFILTYKAEINGVIFLAVSLVVFIFFLQMRYLARLIKQSKVKRIYLDGSQIYLLSPLRPHSVGTFWLGKNYIIWQGALDSLPQNEREAILRHELSHLRQKDTWLKAGLRVIQCFWLLNPIFYYFKKELELLSECIADQQASQALPSPLSYARLLVKVKEWQQAPLTQAFKGGQLRERIKRLTRTAPQHNFYRFFLSAFLLLLMQAFSSPTLSEQVSSFFYTIETYEEIYQKVESHQPEAIYCKDCETVCTPNE